MATRKVRPVHFEAYQEGPDSVIPEDCATVFSSWSSGIIKAPLHAEGLLGKNSAEEERESVVEILLPGSLNAKMLQRSCLENSVWAEDWHCFWSLPICLNFTTPPWFQKPRTRGRDRKPGDRNLWTSSLVSRVEPSRERPPYHYCLSKTYFAAPRAPAMTRHKQLVSFFS